MRSDLDDARIAGLYMKDMSLRAIAAACHCSHSTVRYRLDRMEVARRRGTGRRPARVPDDIMGLLKAGYSAGQSIRALASSYPDYSEDQITRMLRREGIVLRRRGRPRRQSSDQPASAGAV